MTIEQVGSIGELVAAIATVATLVYLATQIRQNTSTSRLNSAAADTQNQNSLSQILAQDQELNRVFWSGLKSRGELDATDQQRFDPFVSMFLMCYEQSWRFHKEGAISNPSWQAQLNSIGWLANQPGFVEYWAVWGSTVPSDFAEVIEDAKRSGNPIPFESNGAFNGTTTDSA